MYKIPKREEYFFRDGKFYMKNKLAGRFKFGVMIGIVLGFLGVAQTTSSHITSPKVTFFDTTEHSLTKYIMSVNNKVTSTDAVQIVKSTMKWSKEFDIDPALLIAVQQIESGFNKYSISSAGAMGVMQVIPKWHLDKMSKAIVEVGNPEPFNIHTNIYLGAWVLKDCLRQYNLQGNALRCYNGSNANPNGYDTKVIAMYNKVNKIMKENG